MAFLPDGFDPTLGPPRSPVASRRQSSRRTEPPLTSFGMRGRLRRHVSVDARTKSVGLSDERYRAAWMRRGQPKSGGGGPGALRASGWNKTFFIFQACLGFNTFSGRAGGARLNG